MNNKTFRKTYSRFLVMFVCLMLGNSSFARLYHVSVNSDGQAGNSGMYGEDYSQISGNGRFVVYASDSDNLVDGDANVDVDIFVHDLLDRTTTRVNIGPNNTEANDKTLEPDISDDGRYVVFTSRADNLVADDFNNALDVFLHDRLLETTTRVSINSEEEEANDSSLLAKISPDGKYVLFASIATNLEEPNLGAQYYVRDLEAGTTRLVSKWSNNEPMPDVFDGDYVATYRIPLGISEGGNYVTFVGPNKQIYWRDLDNDVTKLITHKIGMPNAPANGEAHFPSLSNDGQKITFTYSYDQNGDALMNGSVPNKDIVYIYDINDDSIAMIGPDDYLDMSPGGSYQSQLSGDGKHVSFTNNNPSINSNPLDVVHTENAFVKHLDKDPVNIDLINIDNQGQQFSGHSKAGGISIDGRAISFQSVGYDDNQGWHAYAQVPCIDSIKAPITWIKNGPGIVNLPSNQTKSSQVTVNGRTHGCVASVGVHPKFGDISEADWKALKIDLVASSGELVPIKTAGKGTYVNGSWTKFNLDLRIEGTWTLEVTNTSPRAFDLSMDKWSVMFNFPILQAIPLP